MAKQHFYARVPARVAMYFKANGFDTFASSLGVTQEFIEKDLSLVLEQKPTNEELAQIRKDGLDPIYFHYATKDNVFVESCVSFLNTDYTGERSSYFVHSLIYNEEEERTCHYHNHAKAINEDLFIHNMDGFDITSPTARPIKDYPELTWEYKTLPGPIDWITQEYTASTVKMFIYALYQAIYGKIKCVHVVLPEGTYGHPMRFFNSFIQVVPFHLRKYVSFVSRCSDFNKYPGFKLKVIEPDMGVAPLSKGVTINFRTNEIFGIKEKDYQSFTYIPDFIYRLINKKEERYELFKFVNYVVEQDEELAEADVKVAFDLLNLFRVASNLYDVNIACPDDNAVLTLFTAYEKNRHAMPDEERMNVCKVLKRYPDNFIAIPKQVFNKITKIYPTEIIGTKHIIMGVCLDLIHTDLMRNNLFNFIKSVYDEEDEESKVNIIRHLASVFNGEFLQEQIMEFFKAHFEITSLEARQVIMENLFLAIRTASIQESLFNFFNEKYNILTNEEKKEFYNVCAEHLPEGDELAKKLLGFCDEHIILEPVELQESYSEALCKLLLSEQKHQVELLLPIVSESNGFTFDIVTKTVFTKWNKKKISTDFIALACRGSLDNRIDKVIKMWDLSKDDIDGDIQKKFINSIVQGFEMYPCLCEVDEIFDAQVKIEESLKDIDNEKVEVFLQKFKANIIDKLMLSTLVNVFKSQNVNSVEKLIEFAKKTDTIRWAENYHILNEYIQLKQAINNLDLKEMIKWLRVLASYGEISKRIAQYVLTDMHQEFQERTDEHVTCEKVTLIFIASTFLRTNHIKLNNIYDKLSEVAVEMYQEDDTKKFKVQELISKIFRNLLKLAYAIEKDYSDVDKLMNDVRSYDSGIQIAAGDLISRYGKAQFNACVSSLKEKNKSLIKFITEETKDIKSQAGLFAKVYKL